MQIKFKYFNKEKSNRVEGAQLYAIIFKNQYKTPWNFLKFIFPIDSFSLSYLLTKSHYKVQFKIILYISVEKYT